MPLLALFDDDFDLLLARTYAALGETDKALDEYSALLKRYSGYEARCRQALLLKRAGKFKAFRRTVSGFGGRLDPGPGFLLELSAKIL